VISSTCAAPATKHSGFCSGFPNDVICCVGGRYGGGQPSVPSPPVAPSPPVSAPAGWLSRAGEWVVERIDGKAKLRSFAAHTSRVNKFLLHTIEGTGGNGDWEGGRSVLDNKAFWPHFIVAKDRQGKVHIGQFMSMNVQARACKSPGNVGTIQVEIGGKAGDPFTAKDWLAEPVRALFQAVRVVYPAIPNVAPRAFQGVNRAYGTSAPTRIASSAWASTAGLVGHQHTPGNTHWDPGAIDASVLLVVNAADPDPEPVTDAPTTTNSATPTPSSTADDAEPDEEEDNSPPCVANRVNGMCMPSNLCKKKSFPRTAPEVAGCSHIEDQTVQCCADEPQADGGNLNGQLCVAFGVNGTCESSANCARVGRTSLRAEAQVKGCETIRSADIQCCADTKGQAIPVSNSCPQYAGLSFPLALGSLKEISVNWGFARSSGKRCHAAVDIYTTGARQVVAVSDGEVVSIMKNWYSCSGRPIDAIFVYHSTGALQGKTLNYGEVDPGTYTVRVGSQIKRGDKLGVASRCDMLHFELYQGRRTQNSYWLPSGAIGAGCAKTSIKTKPAELLDPRDLVRCTMPSASRFRNGVSFLEEADDLSVFEADNAADEDGGMFVAGDGDKPSGDGESGGLSQGAAIGIGVGMAVVCIAVAVILLWLVRAKTRRSRRGSRADVDDARDSKLALNGVYTCADCGSSFGSADEVVKHREERH
jgi:hypothetical protein